MGEVILIQPSHIAILVPSAKKAAESGLVYREMIWLDGNCIKSPFFNRIYDAKEWKATQLVKRAQGQIHGHCNNLHRNITVSDFADKWLMGKTSQGIARATRRNYETYLRLHIKPYFKD